MFIYLGMQMAARGRGRGRGRGNGNDNGGNAPITVEELMQTQNQMKRKYYLVMYLVKYYLKFLNLEEYNFS